MTASLVTSFDIALKLIFIAAGIIFLLMLGFICVSVIIVALEERRENRKNGRR